MARSGSTSRKSRSRIFRRLSSRRSRPRSSTSASWGISERSDPAPRPHCHPEPFALFCTPSLSSFALFLSSLRSLPVILSEAKDLLFPVREVSPCSGQALSEAKDLLFPIREEGRLLASLGVIRRAEVLLRITNISRATRRGPLPSARARRRAAPSA